MNAAKFYWAVVGDASPEPVAVVVENGRRVAYTCGCPDPFVVDGAKANIILMAAEYNAHGDTLSRAVEETYVGRGMGNDGGEYRIVPRPLTPPPKPSELAKRRRENEARLKRDAEGGISHGHRRFNP